MSKHKVLVVGSSKYYSRTFDNALYPNVEFAFMNHRGFHETDDDKSFTEQTLVNDIEAVRKNIGWEKFSILGHSIHAFMVMDYVEQYARHIEKVILIGASPVVGEKVRLEADQLWEKEATNARKAALKSNLDARSIDQSIESDQRKSHQENLMIENDIKPMDMDADVIGSASSQVVESAAELNIESKYIDALVHTADLAEIEHIQMQSNITEDKPQIQQMSKGLALELVATHLPDIYHDIQDSCRENDRVSEVCSDIDHAGSSDIAHAGSSDIDHAGRGRVKT